MLFGGASPGPARSEEICLCRHRHCCCSGRWRQRRTPEPPTYPHRFRSDYAAVRGSCRFVYQDAQYHGADLLGVGVASFSYLGGVHQQNRASLGRYTEALEAGELPMARAHALDPDERLVREFVLQLKLGHVARAPMREKHGVEIVERFRDPLERCRQRGWLSIEPEAVMLTRDGLLRVDRIIPEFYRPEHQGIRYT